MVPFSKPSSPATGPDPPDSALAVGLSAAEDAPDGCSVHARFVHLDLSRDISGTGSNGCDLVVHGKPCRSPDDTDDVKSLPCPALSSTLLIADTPINPFLSRKC